MRRLVLDAYGGYVALIGVQPAPMTADYAEVTASGHAWVAERDGEMVGVLVVEPAEDHLLVDNVAVAPHAQGTGLGALLMDVAEDQARAAGLAEVRLYTNQAMTRNIALYERRGYRETHRATQGGHHRVFLTKVLGPRE